MKHLFAIFSLSLLASLSSCSDNNEPETHTFLQPAAITSTDSNGWNQTFDYDDYGRIVSWAQTSNSTNGLECSAHYDYTEKNTIKVTSEEDLMNGDKRYYQEVVQLINGRASKSEGTFIYDANGSSQLRKTYRLEFEYDNSNHLAAVKHSEVIGIGADIEDDAWDSAWSWKNTPTNLKMRK